MPMGALTSKLPFSEFWRVEGQGQSVNSVVSRSLSPRLANGCLLLCPHMLFPLGMCAPRALLASKFPLLVKTPVSAHPNGLS